MHNADVTIREDVGTPTLAQDTQLMESADHGR